MASRDAFNKYSTIAEKINQLNSATIDDYSEIYSTDNIAQTISYQDKNAIDLNTNAYTSTSQAMIFSATVENATGYSEELTVDDLGVLTEMARFYIESTTTLYQDENGSIYNEDQNPQPSYLDNDTGFEIYYTYSDDGKNYYEMEIDSAVYIGDGTYTLFTVFNGYDISTTTFDISRYVYFENGGTVYGFSRLLTS